MNRNEFPANNYNNNLLNGFYNFQMNNIPFKRNALLNNNPNFKQFISQYSPYDEKARFNNIYQQMNKLKNLQQIKRLEKYNDLDKFIDKDTLKESVIAPIKVIKPPINKIVNDYTIIKQTFDPDSNFLKELWNSRTNQPYKNILKNENYAKIPLKNAKKEDLIVHRVTDADKIGLMDEFEELIQILEKHNNELKMIYTTSKEAEYKAKFIYHNASKFRIKYDPADFKKLKKDRIEFYQREQRKLERDKKKLEDLIESAILSGSLTDKDIKELELNDKNENLNELQEELKRELGDEYDEDLIKELLSSSDINPGYKSSENQKNNDDDDEDIAEITEVKPKKVSNKIIIRSKKSDKKVNVTDEIKEKYRNRQKKNINKSIVTEDVKEKYRMRQKK